MGRRKSRNLIVTENLNGQKLQKKTENAEIETEEIDVENVLNLEAPEEIPEATEIPEQSEKRKEIVTEIETAETERELVREVQQGLAKIDVVKETTTEIVLVIVDATNFIFLDYVILLDLISLTL